MDLIPVIFDVTLYFFIALIIVLVISFTYLKFVKKDEEEESKSIEEQRRHIRHYIINQSQYLTSGTSVNRKKLIPQYYSAPTYSRSTSGSKTRDSITKRTTKGELRKTIETRTDRYSIVNETHKNKTDLVYLDPSTKSYSSLKEQRYYQY